MSKTEVTYVGPLLDANRSDLKRLQRRGGFCQRKKDGIWGEVHIRSDRITLTSRRGLPVLNTGLERQDLAVFGNNTKLVVEVDVTTPPAVARTKKIGYVRAWLHDVTMIQGEDFLSVPEETKQALLREQFWPKLPKEARLHFPLVEQVDDSKDWVRFYDRALQDGDEGVVIKKVGVPYRKHAASGKSRDWIRVKPHRDQDLFAMAPDTTEGGALTIQVGLWRNGRAQRVQNLQLPTARLISGELMYINPETKKLESLIGKVFTARCREVWESGGMRGAAFYRWRPDKTPEMCDGTVTLIDM